jgi:DNA-binding MarR family transcriptional regulator
VSDRPLPLTVSKPKEGHDAAGGLLARGEAAAPWLPPESISELADIIMVFQRRFLANLSRELAPGGVSFAQFFLLGALRDETTLSMSEIAHRMGNTTAAATGLVDRLENLDYVERAHATDDRRKVLVHITARGAALVTRIKNDMIHNLSAVMTYLSADEQKAWLSIYRKLNIICQKP